MRDALASVSGTSHVVVDFKTKQAYLTFDERKTSVDKILAALHKKTSYKATFKAWGRSD